jgi:DNA-binding NarL/FixJ family response regulator
MSSCDSQASELPAGRMPLAVIHRNRLLRDCLVAALDTQHLRVIAVDPAGTLEVSGLAEHLPEMVLVDLNLPGDLSLQVIKWVREKWPKSKIIALVTAELEDRLLECFELGIHGFFLEESSIDELKTAIATVSQGDSFCSPRIVRSVFAQMSRMAKETHWRSRAETANLTAREMEVLKLVSQQFSNKQIAKRLSLSLYTVKNHVHNILEKLHVETRAGAVEHVRRQGGLSSL